MFCPTIKDECVGEPCRDWDKESGQCFQSMSKILAEYQQQVKKMIDVLAKIEERNKLSRLWDRVHLTRILDDATTPLHIKQAIEQALKAPNSDVAERLLKDAGLIN